MCIANWIKKWSRIHPGKTAIIEEGREYSYKDLNEQCNRVCNLLLSKGIRKGDRVAALSYNSHKFLTVYFAAGKLGAIFVPLNWRMAVEEIAGVLRDCSPKILFFAEEYGETAYVLKDRVEQLEYVASLGENGPEWHSEEEIGGYSSNEPELREQVGLEDPHIIMYTSGTTGAPKGAILSNRKTFYNALNANIFFNLTQDDILLVSRPLFHSGGLLINATPVFYKGAAIILKRRFSTHEYLETIEKYKVTVAEPAATFLNFVLKECDLENYELGSIKCMFTGGERVGLNLLEEYHKRNMPLSQLFGMTETSTLTWLSANEAFEKAGSVGKPVFHGDLRIINKQGRDVQPGEPGEIVVSGPILMSGYWNRPKQTAQVMKNGWFHTGDLATVDDQGYIYIIDRIRDTYISGGENIHPAEIEKVLLTNPNIFEAAVCGVPDEKWGESGLASIILEEGKSMTAEDVLGFLDGKIGRFKIPRHIQFVDDLPRTASGKIKRYVLTEKYEKKNR